MRMTTWQSLFSKAAARARILGVAGGDGSIRLAAGIAADAGLPLLVVPAGTFNHFAADLGLGSVDDALDALRDGDSVLVDVAAADGAAFLNTASTGVYVDLVRAREKLEPTAGKWPAMLVALVGVLRTGRPVELTVNGRRRRVWLLFAGNCRYEPSGAAPAYRPDLADGSLDIRMVDGSQPLARTRLVVAVLLGTLGRCRVYRNLVGHLAPHRVAYDRVGAVVPGRRGDRGEAGDQPRQAAEEAAGLPPSGGD